MQFSVLALTAVSSLATAQTTTRVPDQPIKFWARLYNDVADCSGGVTKSYLGTMGSCVNIPISGNGSAIMTIGQEAVDYLAGWTGPDCTGQVVMVQSQVGVCQDLGGAGVQSWSNDQKPFGEQ